MFGLSLDTQQELSSNYTSALSPTTICKRICFFYQVQQVSQEGVRHIDSRRMGEQSCPRHAVHVQWIDRGYDLISYCLSVSEVSQMQVLLLRIKTLNYLKLRNWLTVMHSNCLSIIFSFKYITFTVGNWQLPHNNRQSLC